MFTASVPRWRFLASLVLLLAACSCRPRGLVVVGRSAATGTVEFRGVGAGAFDARLWAAGAPHFLPDVRSPLLEPRAGAFRNIYAPSVVALPDGSFRLFYGGWDGTATGNDRIYSVAVGADFLWFGGRRTVVEHGPFQHVCNVSAVREADGSYLLACTAYPVGRRGLNKPVSLRLPADLGDRPLVPSPADVIAVDGDAGYAGGDLNGMNPIVLGEDGRTVHLYFGDFRDFGRVRHATSIDGGRRFVADGGGVALAFAGMPNDAKRLVPAGGGGPVTLLALHQNGPTLYYALSRDDGGDGRRFDRPRVLAEHLGEADRYIVSVAMVVRGNDVLGFLYGAGAVPSLDRNRIFARWLQRKVVFVTEGGRRLTPRAALGPDRALMDLRAPARGRIEIYAEDGVTLLSAYPGVELAPGSAYAVRR